MSEFRASRFKCDWTDEHGDICGEVADFDGHDANDQASRAGWGWYANAYIRRDRWTTGARLWFCPVHAAVFRANHGWGGLEDYGPPKRWWLSPWRTRTGARS